MDPNESIWCDIFDESQRAFFKTGVILIGAVGVLFSSWVSLGIVNAYLNLDKNYLNLSCFVLAGLVRRLGNLLPELFTTNGEIKQDTNIQNDLTIDCTNAGFWETFLTTLEIESLTHLCIERFVAAKYALQGRSIKKDFYVLCICLDIMLACLYSFPPSFGFGKYDLDFDCTTCTYSLILPTTWHRQVILATFLLRTIKPFFFMLGSLCWARIKENQLPDTADVRRQKHMTEMVISITVLNLFCWAQLTLMRGWVIMYQLQNENAIPMPLPASAITVAVWLYWTAPIPTAIILYMYDINIYNSMTFQQDVAQDKDE